MKRLVVCILVLAALAIAIGLSLGHAVYSSRFSYSLDFGAIIDAFVLLFVFVLIDYLYSHHSSAKRADTELMLAIVQEAKAAFRTLAEHARACEGPAALNDAQQFSLSWAERDLSNTVRTLEDSLRHCDVNLDGIGFHRLKDARVELKDSLTDTPYPGPYDNSSRIRIQAAMKSFREELTRIAFAINRR